MNFEVRFWDKYYLISISLNKFILNSKRIQGFALNQNSEITLDCSCGKPSENKLMGLDCLFCDYCWETKERINECRSKA